MTLKQYFQNSHCRSNKDDLSAKALKLTLQGLKTFWTPGDSKEKQSHTLASSFGFPSNPITPWSVIIWTVVIKEKKTFSIPVWLESDHWFIRPDCCDPGVRRCQLEICWGCYCCRCWCWETCSRQFGATLKAIFCSEFKHKGLHQSLKLC